MSIVLICLITLIINVPTGYFRENYPKMSIKWLIALHAPVPFIILIRYIMDISISRLNYFIIPILISIAIIGQIIGSKFFRRNQKKLN